MIAILATLQKLIKIFVLNHKGKNKTLQIFKIWAYFTQ
jgi:hypothetical protein